MKSKVFKKNKYGKIEFTESELKKVLDEIYDEGYMDGSSSNYYYTTPYRYKPYPYYYTWCSTATDPLTNIATTTATSTADSHITIDGSKLSSSEGTVLTINKNEDWLDKVTSKIPVKSNKDTYIYTIKRKTEENDK